MNLTDLARQLRVSPEELREKIPQLGFSVGRHAIKVDDRIASQIMQAWGEMRRKQRLQEKMEEQKKMMERRKQRAELGENATPVFFPPVITVRDLAGVLNLPVPRLMQELMHNGIMASLNERIDYDTAAIVAEDLGFAPSPKEQTQETIEETASIDRIVNALQEERELLVQRPPVVVVMGHVDHGKTKLLDAIRKTHVVDTEAGGITQHIGAYQVERKNKLLTFIDTPGHEAFTVMRSRGAKVADLAILVVAADDGVQPQTKEAIDIITSSGMPFLVALNKIDRAEANIDRVKGELAEVKVVSEDWGGNVMMVPISAKQLMGIDDLLDALLLLADMEKERTMANPDRRAIGTIIESHVDTAEGPVATALIQSGTLRIGDVLGVRDGFYGRVRAMRSWSGELLKEAPPSTPVKIIGFKYAPAMGEILEVPEEAKKLKKLKVVPVRATEEVASIKHTELESTEETKKAILPIIIKADVLGSLEALLGMFDKIQHELVGIKVIQRGLGNITDGDVLNAETSKAVIYGFNVHAITSAHELAREKKVSIQEYQVIYKLFDDVLDRLQGLLPEEQIIEELGQLEVKVNFHKKDRGWIVGGKVVQGKILAQTKMRILRKGEIVGEGEIEKLQIGKSQVKDVLQGQECGISYKGKVKAEPGDILEVYQEELKKQWLTIKGIKKR